jgi:hypothetical protein
LKFKIEEKIDNSKTIINLSNLITLCPHRKYDKEDVTDLELVYQQSIHRYRIDKSGLEIFIEKKIEDKEIPMEMIPIRILKYCIESTAGRFSSRYASPEWVEISSHSASKSGAKKFKMNVKIKFSREVIE